MEVNNENSTSSSSTNKQYCSEIHREAIQYCSTNNNNRVINRIGTATQQQILQRWGEQRRYSLSSHLLENNTPLPQCQSLEDYLKAIKYGKRISIVLLLIQMMNMILRVCPQYSFHMSAMHQFFPLHRKGHVKY